MKEHDKVREDFVIVEKEILEPLNRILHTTKLMMTAIKDKFKGGDPIVYIGGKDNFREDVASEMPYKGNRFSKEKRQKYRDAGRFIEWLDATEEKYKAPVRPFYEDKIREYLIKYWGAIVVDGQEADDALGIKQTLMEYSSTQMALSGKQYIRTVIVTVDKDLKMIKGWNQNLSGMDTDPELIDPLTADRNFYAQLISGDGVDNIPGIKGYGKVKSAKAVAECNTIKEMWDAVQQVYLDKDDGISRETIIQRAQLLWIRRNEEELWEPI